MLSFSRRTRLIALCAIVGGIAVVLVISATRHGDAQGPSDPTLDIYSLLSVRYDYPDGFEVWEGPDIIPGAGAGQRWRGTKMDPSKPASPLNKILESAAISIGTAKSAEDARKYAHPPKEIQAPIRTGSYSGKPLGDICYRSLGDSATSAPLWLARKNVILNVDVYGTTGRNWVAINEAVAQALVDRIDATYALTASADTTAFVGTRDLESRQPNGVSVIHVQDYADATGAAAKVDLPGGTAEITRGGHTLKVNIGRKEAWFDGQPFTLPFPALRHGKDQVWCPLDALKRLGN
jgi:hypothetical protein